MHIQFLGRMIAVVGVCALVIAACGGGEAEKAAPQPTTPPVATSAPGATAPPVAGPTATPRPTAAPAPTATAAPVSSGQLTLTFGALGNFALLPFPVGTQTSYIRAMYDDLVGPHRPDLSPYPKGMDFERGFATSVTSNADSTVWTVKTRKGVLFHSGDEATAKDMAYSTGLMLTKDNQYVPGTVLQRLLTSMETPDNETVVFALNSSSIFFPAVYLSLAAANIQHSLLPQKYHESIGGWREALKKPIGSGPYNFRSVAVGDRIVLEAVDRHWYWGVPRTKTLTFVVIPDETTRLALLRSGEADFGDISEANVARAQAANLQVFPNVGAGLWALIAPLSVDRPLQGGGPNPMSNENVRKAMAWHAIDRPGLVRAYFPKTGILIADFPVGPADPAYDPNNKTPIPPFDLSRARDLLAQGGYPGGFKLDMLISPQAPPLPEVIEAVASSWEQIGIKVNRLPVSGAAQTQRWIAGLRDGYSTPTVFWAAGPVQPVAAEVYVAQVHNTLGLTYTNAEPEAVRLAEAYRGARTVDDYIRAGRAYQAYVHPHVLSWWGVFSFNTIVVGSSKIPAAWQEFGQARTPGSDIVSAAARR